MKKNTFILLTTFLLIITTVYATVNNPKPTITVTTDESSTVVSYSLTNSTGDELSIEPIYTSSDKKEFRFRPQQNLLDGDYSFTITLKDEFDNINQESIDFTIELGTLDIQIAQPKDGYTSTRTFDLIVQTDRAAYCKYDHYAFSFENMREFDQSGNVQHIKYSYTLDLPYKYNLKVKCQDSFKDEIVSKDFTFYFDDTPPTITEKKADPSIVVQYPPQTKLIVKTDEDTCLWPTSYRRYRYS